MNSYQNIGKYGTYLSAYGIAVKRGYKGTEQEWLQSLKGDRGDRVELRYEPGGNRLQWRYSEGQWQDLMGLSELQTELQQATMTRLTDAVRQSEEIESIVTALSRTAEAYADTARGAAQTAALRATDAEQSGVAAENARTQAMLSQQAAEQAKRESEAAVQDAGAYKGQAEAAVTAAQGQALSARSWAAGGTGTRENEDVDNARYWAKQAENASGGGVLSFRGRSGYVQPLAGDYTAGMVGADAAGSAAAVKTELSAELRVQRELLDSLDGDCAVLGSELASHASGAVLGERGAHGLRYLDGGLAFRDAGVWRPLPLGGGTVYACTGEGDDSAISELVNSFLNRTGKWADTPHASLKLTVRGQVGFSASPQYGTGAAADPYRFFSFESEEQPGGGVTIDWADACFPNTVQVTGTTALLHHRGVGCVLSHEGLCVSLASGTPASSANRLTILCAQSGADVQLRNSHLADSGISSKLTYVTMLSAGSGARVSCGGLRSESGGLSSMFLNEGGTLCLDQSTVEGHKALNQVGGETHIRGSRFRMVREGLSVAGGRLIFADSLCDTSSDSYNNGALIVAGGGAAFLSNSRLSSGYQLAVSLSQRSFLYASGTDIRCADNWVSYGITAANSVLQVNGCLVEGAVGIADLGGNELSIESSRCVGVSRGIQNHGGSTVTLADSLCVAKGVASGEEDPFYHAYEDGFGLSIENTSAVSVTKLSARGCRFRGYRCGDSAVNAGFGIQVTGDSGGQNNILSLYGCVFDAVSLEGRIQTGALRLGSSDAITPRYAILGCMFHTADVLAGGSGIIGSGAAGRYMPEGANFFSVTG